MAFKMKGSPAKTGGIQGTAGHRSALKARSEELASALKQVTLSDGSSGPFSQATIEADKKKNETKSTDPTDKALTKAKSENDAKTKTKTKTKKSDPYAEAKKKDPNLDKYIKERGKHKAGSAEYEAVQAKINKAYGKKRDPKVKAWQMKEEAKKSKTTTKTVKSKPEKIDAKAAKGKAEIDENTAKAKAKHSRKVAKVTHGKGSKEHLEAKMAHLKAKEADRQGSGGGTKQSLFRGIGSWVNKRRQARTQKKLDKLA
tara:strand:+ start:2465 stop:3235 length:771 start_codon:yes stop_codon:yes gene_type:complete